MTSRPDRDRHAPGYLPYRDSSLPIGERVRDLLSRMTIEEKAAQTAAPFGTVVDTSSPPATGWGGAVAALSSLGVPPRDAAAAANELQRKHVEETRLGIPILLGEEALLGLKVRGATTFPDAIAQASTWDPALIEEMGAVIGGHMSALGVRQALSPVADVSRDPRWGRVGETYGEEPFLVGSIATAFVRGLQEAVPGRPLIATLKHFLAYGASEGGRNTEPVSLGQRVMRETYGVPFEMAIRDGHAQGIMPSYTDIDGDPVTGSRELLTDLLREEYGFNGLVISDLDAVAQLHTKHSVVSTTMGAFARALTAGLDQDLDNRVSSGTIVDAVAAGLLAEVDLDRPVASVLRAKFRLGLFEDPYVDVEAVPESLDDEAARQVARTISEKSIVLLQNDPVDGEPLLPLRSPPRTIAVVGPNAHRIMGQLGHYSYQVLDSMTARFAQAANPQARAADDTSLAGALGADDVELLVESVPVVTFLEGIRDRAGDGTSVLYEPGCPIERDDRSGFAAAVGIAERADIAIVVVGDQAGINSRGTVGEGLDSATCELPKVQRALVEAIAATGTPTIVVLSHGRPYALGWMTTQAPAIVSTWFGGEEAGTALASVLFGDVNPAGRLPISMLETPTASPVPYWRTMQQPAYVDGSIRAVFPFGHGLSYTRFEYRDLDVEARRVPASGTIRLALTVANVGQLDGDEVVQVYGRDVHARSVRPGRKLIAFQRLHLAAGSEQRIVVEVPADAFALWDPSEGWIVEPGAVRLFVGGSSAQTPLRTEVELTGAVTRPGAGRAFGGSVSVTTSDHAFDHPVDVAEPDASVAPLTSESTVSDWLAHPTGRGVLLTALGEVDDERLGPILGHTLGQMVLYSEGVLPHDLPGTLLSRVTPSPAPEDVPEAP